MAKHQSPIAVGKQLSPLDTGNVEVLASVETPNPDVSNREYIRLS